MALRAPLLALLLALASLAALAPAAQAAPVCVATPQGPACADAFPCLFWGVGVCGNFAAPGAKGRFYCIVLPSPGAACDVLADGRPGGLPGAQVGFGAGPAVACAFAATTLPAPALAHCVRLR